MKSYLHAIASVVFAALFVAPAQAHAPLQASNPANGAVLATAEVPAELELQFGGNLRLTSATLERHDGERVTLETSGLGPAGTHRLPLPELTPGDYTVRWRGLAADGHVMSGEVSFTVADP